MPCVHYPLLMRRVSSEDSIIPGSEKKLSPYERSRQEASSQPSTIWKCRLRLVCSRIFNESGNRFAEDCLDCWSVRKFHLSIGDLAGEWICGLWQIRRWTQSGLIWDNFASIIQERRCRYATLCLLKSSLVINQCMCPHRLEVRHHHTEFQNSDYVLHEQS